MSANLQRSKIVGLILALALTVGSVALVGSSAAAARGSGKKFTVTATSKSVVTARSKFAVKGKVRPAAARAKVKLQRKRPNGRWNTVQRERLRRSSHYSFRVQAGRAGSTVKVRVVKLRTRTKKRAVSRVRTVRVVATRAPSRRAQKPTVPAQPPTAVAQKEARVLDLTNTLRASGTTCGGTWMPPAAPLVAEPHLVQVARAHATDMVNRNYLTHDTLEGVTPWVRMTDAGYHFAFAAENIAGGYPSAEAAVAGWTDSAGHCTNMMNPNLRELGVGFAASPNSGDARWVQVFGTRR